MSTRRTTRPVMSFLLRVQEEHIERTVLRYELQDLASGQTLRFNSLAALRRHLGQAGGGDEGLAPRVPATPPGTAAPTARQRKPQRAR